MRFVFQVLGRLPKRVSVALAVLLLCGGGAFALVSFVPDVSDMPVQEVRESVTPSALAPASSVLDRSFRLFRTEITRPNDTAPRLLGRLGVVDAKAADFLRTNQQARQALFGRGGRLVSAETSKRNRLQKLTVRWRAGDNVFFNRLVVEKSSQGFTARMETAPLTASKRLASGTIESSLFAATDAANIPDAVAVQLAEIFSGDIDFYRALRQGDRFSVVYEVLEADGEALSFGRVLSAEFLNNGHTFSAMWYPGPGADGRAQGLRPGAYYTLEGQSLRRSFLAAPIRFSRVSSGFSMRFHPILKVWKRHLGVDYAAPVGTAVHSVGDGVVTFAGVQRGFGKVVYVQHRNRYTTVYAHLSRISVRLGQAVNQSQIIGAVGATGWVTGPHLHFEYRLNGTYQNPMKVVRQSKSAPISASAKAAFTQQAALSRLALAAAASLQVGNAQ